MIHGKTEAWSLAGIAVAAMLALAGSASAQMAKNLPAGAQALLGPAKSEGELTVYGISVNPEQNAGFNKGFNAFYGFDAKLKMVSGLHPQKIAEIVQATKQGVPSGLDVFWTSATGGGDLEEAGALNKVDWVKEFGVGPDLLYGPFGLRAQDGTLVMVAYNHTLIAPAQAPKSYEDLLNPAYKGRIAIPRTSNIFAFLAFHWGEEKTGKYVADIIEKQQARLLATFPDARSRLISGEFALSIGPDVFLEKRQGAPVDNAPVDPVIVTPWATHVMKDAKNPNLAKLWGYWLTTPDGQKTMSEFRGLSRYDVEGTDLNALAKGKKAVVVPADWTRANVDRLSNIYGKTMGIVR